MNYEKNAGFNFICVQIRKMEGYVNVNFFWAGETIRRSDDIRYSVDPKKMKYIRCGTSYEELKEIVYGVMQLSSLQWRVKLSYNTLKLVLVILLVVLSG